MRYLLLAASALALAGCGGGGNKGGLTAAECLTADWRAIGYEDGSRGRNTDNIGNYRRSCAEHGVTPDLDSYLAGHAQGIAVFCQPQNGFRLGTRGHQYNGGCPFAAEGAFMAAMADGYGLYERQSAVNNIRRQLTQARQRSQQIEYLLVERSASLASPLILPEERIAIGLDIKNLVQEKAELSASIPQLEQDYASAQADYEAYRASLSGYYAES